MSEILSQMFIGLPVVYPLFSSYFNETWIFSKYFRKMSNFVKIRLVGAKYFHADGRTNRNDEATNRLSQVWEYTGNTPHIYIYILYMIFIQPDDGFFNRNMSLMINTPKIVYSIDLYLFYLRVPYYYHNKQLFFP